MKKLAVLVSGGGTNLQAIIDGVRDGEIHAELEIVISSKPCVYALERARLAGIKTAVIAKNGYTDAAAFTDALLDELKNNHVDGIVLAGYMSILDKRIIDVYPNRIINIHPALIPSFCGEGYYGIRVHRAVLEYGAKVSGATVHFVDEGADTGPIIMQDTVPVEDDDTPEILAARVLQKEHKILKKSVALFCEDRLIVEGRRVKFRR